MVPVGQPFAYLRWRLVQCGDGCGVVGHGLIHPAASLQHGDLGGVVRGQLLGVGAGQGAGHTLGTGAFTHGAQGVGDPGQLVQQDDTRRVAGGVRS